MALYGYHTGTGLSPRVTGAFCRGAKAPLLHISTFLEGGLPADATAVAMYGILRGTGLLYREAARRGLDFYYLDHGYFRQSWHPFGWLGVKDKWFRVTLNAHTASSVKPAPHKRFRRYFAGHYPLADWRGGQGRYILVLPPTPAIKWMFSCADWPQAIVERIRKITDLPIVWREKPGSKNVDERGFPDGTIDVPAPPAATGLTSSNGSLNDDLDGALAVVCYNSNVAIEAVSRGIPVICEPLCPAYPIGFPIEALADPRSFSVEPDRAGWLASLAWQQFSRAELRSGFAARRLGLR